MKFRTHSCFSNIRFTSHPIWMRSTLIEGPSVSFVCQSWAAKTYRVAGITCPLGVKVGGLNSFRRLWDECEWSQDSSHFPNNCPRQRASCCSSLVFTDFILNLIFQLLCLFLFSHQWRRLDKRQTKRRWNMVWEEVQERIGRLQHQVDGFCYWWIIGTLKSTANPRKSGVTYIWALYTAQ